MSIFRRKSPTPPPLLELPVLATAPTLEEQLRREERRCPTCGNSISNPMTDRCPRCFTLVPSSEHTNCGDCSHQGNCAFHEAVERQRGAKPPQR